MIFLFYCDDIVISLSLDRLLIPLPKNGLAPVFVDVVPAAEIDGIMPYRAVMPKIWH